MNDGIRTSVLSKEWKGITSSLSNLEFGESHTEKFKTVKFADFIDAIISRHDGSNIRRFCLNVNIRRLFIPFHRIYAWFSFAVAHNVEELELRVNNFLINEIGRLPPPFFTCKTLTVLILESMENAWPLIVKFPALKSFTLQESTFHDKETFNRIISSSTCPVLEDLSIIYCLLPLQTTISISNPSIKSIIVYDMNNLPIKISITTLRQLECICIRPSNFSFQNLSTLSSAVFDFDEDCDDPQTALDAEFNCVTKLVKCLSNVKKLDFNSNIIEILSRRDARTCLSFPCCGVKDLHLSMYSVEVHVQVIKLLIRIYPNVETLRIHIDIPVSESSLSETADKEEEWQLKEMSHENILNCLRTVEISNFQGHEPELEIVRYLVENAKCLGNLNIKFSSSNVLLAEVGSQRDAEITALMSSIAKDFPNVSTCVVKDDMI